MSIFTEWVHRNSTILQSVGPYITATVLVLTFYGTIRMTKSQRKSDTMIGFGQEFRELMGKQHLIERERDLPDAVAADNTRKREYLKQEALQFYSQAFSLQFNEFHAYRQGYIDRAVYMIWMKSRQREYARPENIQGVTYPEGFEHWFNHRHNRAEDTFVQFMRRIHAARTDQEVHDAVDEYGPWWRKCRTWIGWKLTAALALGAFAISLYLLVSR